MGFFSRFKGSGAFRPERMAESLEDVSNPARGWYRIAPYNLAHSLDRAEFLMPGDERDRVVLLRVELADLAGRDMSAVELARLDEIISRWADAGRDVVLRCCYDVEGYGYEREPTEMPQVLRHAAQVGEVLRSHENDLLVYQGLLVGSWGEMHHSRYLSNHRLKDIYSSLRSTAGPNVPVVLRTPRHLRQVVGNGRLGEDGPLGVFNDAMMGSETDLATFGTNAAGAELPRGTWNRRAELETLGKLGQIVAMGGEAVGKSSFSRGPEAFDYLRTTQVTYLNRTHDPQTLARWASSSGKDGWAHAYAYIGAHLGYRMVCEQANAYRQDNGITCELRLANRGFARPHFVMEARLRVAEGSRVRSVAFAGIPRAWSAGGVWSLAAHMPEVGESAVLSLELKRVRDGAPVRLANEGAGKTLRLGVWK